MHDNEEKIRHYGGMSQELGSSDMICEEEEEGSKMSYKENIKYMMTKNS